MLDPCQGSWLVFVLNIELPAKVSVRKKTELLRRIKNHGATRSIIDAVAGCSPTGPGAFCKRKRHIKLLQPVSRCISHQNVRNWTSLIYTWRSLGSSACVLKDFTVFPNVALAVPQVHSDHYPLLSWNSLCTTPKSWNLKTSQNIGSFWGCYNFHSSWK